MMYEPDLRDSDPRHTSARVVRLRPGPEPRTGPAPTSRPAPQPRVG